MKTKSGVSFTAYSFTAYQIVEKLLSAEERAANAELREKEGRQREDDLTKKLFEMVNKLKKYER